MLMTTTEGSRRNKHLQEIPKRTLSILFRRPGPVEYRILNNRYFEVWSPILVRRAS